MLRTLTLILVGFLSLGTLGCYKLSDAGRKEEMARWAKVWEAWHAEQDLKMLRRYGLREWKIGNRSVLIVPTKKIFYRQTHQILESAAPMLDSFYEHLRRENPMSLRIRVYHDQSLSDTNAKMLTDQRAQALNEYFLRLGLFPRLMRVEGMGNTHPMFRPRGHHTPENQRIEISLRRVPDELDG